MDNPSRAPSSAYFLAPTIHDAMLQLNRRCIQPCIFLESTKPVVLLPRANTLESLHTNRASRPGAKVWLPREKPLGVSKWSPVETGSKQKKQWYTVKVSTIHCLMKLIYNWRGWIGRSQKQVYISGSWIRIICQELELSWSLSVSHHGWSFANAQEMNYAYTYIGRYMVYIENVQI